MFHQNKEEATFYSKSSHPGSQLGPFNVNEVSKLCSSDWTEQVSVLGSKKRNQGFLAVVDSDYVNKQDIAREV